MRPKPVLAAAAFLGLTVLAPLCPDANRPTQPVRETALPLPAPPNPAASRPLALAAALPGSEPAAPTPASAASSRPFALTAALPASGPAAPAAPSPAPRKSLSKTETEALRSSLLAGVKILQGWTAEAVFSDTRPAATGQIPQKIILLAKKGQKAWVRGQRLLIQAPISDYEFRWTGEKNEFVLHCQIPAKDAAGNGKTTEHYVMTALWESGRCRSVWLASAPRGTFPALLLQKGSDCAVFDGDRLQPPFRSQSVETLLCNETHSLLKITLPPPSAPASAAVSDAASAPACVFLLEDGQKSELLQAVLDWSWSPQESPQYLARNAEGKLFYKSHSIQSKTFPDHPPVPLYLPDRGQTDTAFPLFTQQAWWLYHKGQLLGPYSEIPKAFQLFENGTQLYAQLNTQKNQWFWVKDGIELTETDFFDFSPDDARLKGDHYAVVRKQGGSFQVYADFESRLSTQAKPSCSFVSEKLLKITASGANPFYGLYQLDTQRLYTQSTPMEIQTFENDAFDFWLKKEGGWTAYREGLPLGQVQSEDPDRLLAFLIKRVLFFPDWNHPRGIMLVGEGGQLGPFKRLTPLERPERTASESHLFSSLIGTTSEGVTAIYGDAIIGPADRITPFFAWNNPFEVKGLLVEFADAAFLYSLKGGMQAVDTASFSKPEWVAGTPFVADDVARPLPSLPKHDRISASSR